MADERFGGMLGMMQGLEEPEEYYEVLQRPLEADTKKFFYNWTQRTPDFLPRFAHWHLWTPSGKNQGFRKKNEFFMEQKDKRSDYERVRNRLGKYPASQVEQALRQREKGWEDVRDFFERNPWINLDGFDSFMDNYHIMANNCHDLVDFAINPNNVNYRIRDYISPDDAAMTNMTPKR